MISSPSACATQPATAISGAYVGRVWGGKAKPEQLIPRFGPRDPRVEFERLKAFFSKVPGPVKVTERPDRGG